LLLDDALPLVARSESKEDPPEPSSGPSYDDENAPVSNEGEPTSDEDAPVTPDDAANDDDDGAVTVTRELTSAFLVKKEADGEP
jgi:hypothetical protein